MTSNTKSSRTTGNEAGLEGVKSALDPLTILFTGLPNFRLWFFPLILILYPDLLSTKLRLSGMRQAMKGRMLEINPQNGSRVSTC